MSTFDSLRLAPIGHLHGHLREQPRHPIGTVLITLLLGALLLGASGCAVVDRVKPESPRVTVDGVKPLNLSLTRQRLAFRLRVENPNDFELPLRELDFTARVAGDRIASGRSDERVTIPANGEAYLTVNVEAGMSRIIGRIRQMLDDQTLELDYDVTGFVRLDNWPSRIPFDVDGVLENPLDTENNAGGVDDADDMDKADE